MNFLSTPIPVVPFLILMVFLIFLSTFVFDSGKTDIFKYRRNQAKNSSKNSFRQKFGEEVDRRVSYSKKDEIEVLCLNAGLTLSYSDYVLLCTCISIGLFMIFAVLVGNIFLAIIFAVFGFIAPKQVITFFKNKRIAKLEKQIGPFMKMVVKRYEYTGDFEKAMIGTTKEFYGVEPLFSELSKTTSEMSIGVPINEALDNLATRTSNKYLGLLADYYNIAYQLGTDEIRKKLLSQAYIQYEENRRMKEFLKEQTSEPIRDSGLMILTVPVFFVVGCFGIDGFYDFYMHQTLGQIVLAVVILILFGVMLFINKVVAAPLEKREKKKPQAGGKK